MENPGVLKTESPSIDFKQLLENFQEKSNIQNEIQSNIKEKEQNPDTDYYQECCKLYIANVILTTQLKELLAENNLMQTKLDKYEKKSEASELEKQKRHRRIASEIQRNFVCPVESCKKQYGAEASLTQHLKLKHPNQYFKILQNFKSGSIQDNNSIDNTSQKEASLLKSPTNQQLDKNS